MGKPQWNLFVSEALDGACKTAAKAAGKTLSAFIREAVEAHLNGTTAVVLSSEELEALTLRAESFGLTLPTYLRQLARKDAKLPTM